MASPWGRQLIDYELALAAKAGCPNPPGQRHATPFTVALFLTRTPPINASDFRGRWLSVPLSQVPSRRIGLVHNAPAPIEVPIECAPPTPFHGVDELAFVCLSCAASWFGSDKYRRDWPEPRFTDPADLRAMMEVGKAIMPAD